MRVRLSLPIRLSMQLDKRKTSTVNQLLGLDAICEERGPRGGRPAPANKSLAVGHPLPTSTASHTPLSVLDGRSGFAQRERGATDTPLSMYAMHRARYKMSVLSSLLTPREIPQTVQVQCNIIFIIYGDIFSVLMQKVSTIKSCVSAVVFVCL